MTTDTEALLGRHGAAWDYDPSFDLSQVDRPESAKEQYRLIEVHPEVVDRYAEQMADGWGDFPPLVLRRGRGKRLVLISGMHRFHAAERAGISEAPAYLVRCSPKVGLLIALEDNAKHGQPLGNSERGALGARLVLEHGLSQSDAAAQVGVSVSTVNRAVLVASTQRRAERLGVATDGLGFMVIEELGRIDDDEVLARAAAAAHALPSGAGKEFVSRVRRTLDTEGAAEAVAVVAEREGMVRTRHRGGRGVRVPAADRLADLCWALGDIDPAAVAEGVTDAGVWHERLLTAARRIMTIDQHIRGEVQP